MNDDRTRTKALAANLAALEQLLKEAAWRSAEGCQRFNEGKRNAAIGGILGLEETLADAAALYRAIMLLHRRARP